MIYLKISKLSHINCVRLYVYGVSGISQGTILTLKTSLNTNLVNMFNSNLFRSSLPNLSKCLSFSNFESQIHISILPNNHFLNVMILENFLFEHYTQKLNVLLEFQQANSVRYLPHH